jgi:hypothetical protein
MAGRAAKSARVASLASRVTWPITASEHSQVPRTTTFLAGPRVTFGGIGIQAFLHGLVGGEHSSNDNRISGGALAYALGGGADLPIAPVIKLRLAIDHLSAPSVSPSNGTQIRFTAGFAVHF